MKKKRLKASFTIEAAVVVPITMVLIAALIMVSFALHDRVLLSTAVFYEVMDHAKGFQEDPEESAAQVRALLQKRLIAAKQPEVSVREGAEGKEAEATGMIPLPSGLIGTMTGSSFQEVRTHIRISNLDGRKVLTEYKTICDGLSALGSGSKKPEGEQE